MDKIYYKHDSIYEKIRTKCEGKTDGEIYLLEGNSQAVVEELVKIVNKYGTPRMRLKSTLYQVYHHSIHNRFNEAKDLLMKSHIGENILH